MELTPILLNFEKEAERPVTFEKIEVDETGDKYIHNVVLSIPGEDNLFDYTGKTVTVNGDTTLSAVAKPFGKNSIYFDGTGDYLSLADSADWFFGTGDFTIEFWMKSPGNSSWDQIMGQRDSAGAVNADCPFGLVRNSTTGVLIFTYWNGASESNFSSTTVVFDNTWRHIAISRYGTALRMFVDGVYENGATLSGGFSFSNSTKLFSIGRAGEYNGQYYLGYIKDLRITKNIAKYTSNFTPVKKVLSNLNQKHDIDINSFTKNKSLYLKPVYSANTDTTVYADKFYLQNVLVLPFDGSDATTSIKDYSIKNKTVSVYGSAQLDTANKKFGTSSLLLNGTTDYISVPASSDFAFGTGNFTIEAFIYQNATPDGGGIICEEFSSPDIVQFAIGYGSTAFGTSGSNIGFGYYNSSAWTTAFGPTLNNNQWYHIALVRLGNIWTLYVDGNNVAQTTISASIVADERILIGRRWDTSGIISYFNGWIDEVRITKGIARYTRNFIPPKTSILAKARIY